MRHRLSPLYAARIDQREQGVHPFAADRLISDRRTQSSVDAHGSDPVGVAAADQTDPTRLRVWPAGGRSLRIARLGVPDHVAH